ncbi:VWA domain-containing protein [Lacihabitans sp. LS3-19]|uniref:vWA domain-containing protein n=1 Tax=Lacihabitans sp. LS3-19 TaxID=2487335 RepID=UPI0020CFDC07|nr:VWA domain-containing protein [Lacihabitans sp. LS3-19]MCP9767084.1 VWA domain-containing protein [Lacihabitans sp. LS3-19]
MRKLLFIIITTFVTFGCTRIVEIEIPPYKAEPSGSVLTSRVVSSNPGSYIVEVDLHIVDDRAQYIRNLTSDNFSIPSSYPFENYTFSLNDFKRGLSTDYKGTYAAMFLMDQSGSILSTDPYDSRVEAANIFLNNLGPSDVVGLSSFTNSYFTVHHKIGSEISQIRSTLNILANSEGGGTPLYISTFDLTELLSTMTTIENKALIVFTDGGDTNGGKTPDQIIQLAKEKNIQIYTVGLGGGLNNLDVLSKIAYETGGYFMWAEDANQLISYFGTLGNLLQGNANFYRIRFEIKTPSPITSKTNFIFNIEVALSPVKTIKIPILVTLP